MIRCSLWIMLMTPLVLSCHNGYHYQMTRSRARAAKLLRNEDSNNLTNSELQPLEEDVCAGQMFTPFTALELRSSAILEEFPLLPELNVAEGGRLTCSFDNPKEFCSWHTAAGDGYLKISFYFIFHRAHYAVPIDLLRFECTTPAIFNFDGGFLLAGGEAAPNEKAAIETEIQCLYDDSILKFDIWSNSEEPNVRVCLTEHSGSQQCQDIIRVNNPINISIPQTMESFTLKIEVEYLSAETLVLIDNIYFEGRICELIPEEDEKEVEIVTLPTRTMEPLPENLPVLVTPSKRISIPMEISIPSTSELPPSTVTNDVTDELTACEALTCNFNEEHSCFYGLSGIGSTAPWLSGHKLVGNRHTGIQRLNLNDPMAVGFVYAGEDINGKRDSETFVMESPKFSLTSNILLVFDVYQRSYGPILKVCLDSFDYCPYKSSELDPKLFWRTNEKLFVPPGIRKIYFLVENVRGNQFLALDNIRVEAENGMDICESSEKGL